MDFRSILRIIPYFPMPYYYEIPLLDAEKLLLPFRLKCSIVYLTSPAPMGSESDAAFVPLYVDVPEPLSATTRPDFAQHCIDQAQGLVLSVLDPARMKGPPLADEPE